MIPQPSQAVIDADCESRKDVGIGEVILLKILPESLPDIGETEWTLTMKTNGVDAKFHSGNPNDNQSNPSTTSSNGPIAMNATEAYKGASTHLKIKVKDIENGAVLRVRATLKNGDARVKDFIVYKPEKWVARNEGPSGVLHPQDPDYISPFMFNINDAYIYTLCQPISVNFENVYFREIDKGSPLDLKPKPAAETFWGDFIHRSGESDGPAHQLDFSCGHRSMPDNLGFFRVGVYGPKNNRRELPVAEVKRSIDQSGTHSFYFNCGFFLYDSKDEQRQVVQSPFSKMKETRQEFRVGKAWPGTYFSEIRKFGTVSYRAFSDTDLTYTCISLINNGWIGD